MRKVTLVHGFWHGSRCWSLVTGQLAGRGIQPVAAGMDGHGLKNRSPHSRWGRPFGPAAFAPVSGLPAGAYIVSPEHEGSMVPDLLPAGPAVTDALRTGTGDRGRHAAIRETFYGDVDEATGSRRARQLALALPVPASCPRGSDRRGLPLAVAATAR
jgi:hypothetical protein